jgi:DNA-binding beta-propeller fold protein YncE
MRRRFVVIASAFAALIAVLGVGQNRLQANMAARLANAPRFEVDPLWPKPLPNHWILGMVIGVGIDSKDHVFIIHRGAAEMHRAEQGADPVGNSPAASECCRAAPPVLEFDPEGNLVKAWGGTSTGSPVWPVSNHGISVDKDDNIWIGGNGVCSDSLVTAGDCKVAGSRDSYMLKFSHEGKFLAQYGTDGQRVDSKAMDHFGQVAKISFDTKAGEAFIADGYGNHRVAVVDDKTGAIKRIWGAYGNAPSDSNFGRYNPDAPLISQFRTPVHCAEPSNDGLVYVCDRPNDRLQVFTKDGKFQKEMRYFPKTLGDGSVWDVAFSRDPQQTYMYMADGRNERVYVIDRKSLEIITMFGDGGRQPGMFFAVHSVATDSKGNLYTTETYRGQRVQKFLYKGLAPVSAMNQGVVWPKK